MKLEKHCFGYKHCGQVVVVDDQPVHSLSKSTLIFPKLDGPFLCPDCRFTPVAKLARVAMDKKFSWKTRPERNTFEPNEK